MSKLNKKEAQAYLNISERTLERYVKKHKIAVRYENTEHGRQPFFPLAELDRIKEERCPTYQGAIILENPVIQDEQAKIQAWVDTAVYTQLLLQLDIKLTLNLNEASMISGLKRSHLLKSIKSGELRAKKFKEWRVRQEDLRAYINGLWDGVHIKLLD